MASCTSFDTTQINEINKIKTAQSINDKALNEEAEIESEVVSSWNGGIASTCRPRDEGVEH